MSEPPPPSFGHRRNVPTIPAAARIYNYLIGGRYYNEVDARVAKKLLADYPMIGLAARYNYAWVQRVTQTAVKEWGVDQILDIGAGIPAEDPVHEIAQKINPQARVAYADYEQIAVQIGREILAGNPHATFIQADIRQPELIFYNDEVLSLLDFKRPILVIFAALLHFIPPQDRPTLLVYQYQARLVPGSYIAISHVTAEMLGDEERPKLAAMLGDYRDNVSEKPTARTAAHLQEMMAGTELTEDGVVPIPDWHAGPEWVADPADLGRRAGYAVVGRVV